MKEVQQYVDEIFHNMTNKTPLSDENLGLEAAQEVAAMELRAKYDKPELEDDDYKLIIDDINYNYTFLNSFAKHLATKYKIKQSDIDLKFINYGTMSLVYVMKVKDEQFAVFLGYPQTPFGSLEKESKNLNIFGCYSDRVIPTCHYFVCDSPLIKRELFSMPYFFQARTISSKNKHFGIYIPEPEYHFKKLSQNATEVLQTCMIATLVESFDSKNKKGISKVEVVGGDFILEKDWNSNKPTIEDTLSKIKLIAARDYVECSFKDYLDLIREEFSVETKRPETFLANNNYVLSTCNETPFSTEVIEKGIDLGKQLRKEHFSQKYTTDTKEL